MTVGNVLQGNAAVSQQNFYNKLDEQQKVLFANTPDKFLEQMARQSAYEQYNNDATRNVTKAVGNSVPFVDSFISGALHNGSSAAKAATSASTATDWGIFTGAVWLFNKALGKVYDTFPGLKKAKEDYPTAAFVGEVGSAVLIGRGAVRGFHFGFRKLAKGKEPVQIVEELLNKSPKAAEAIGKVFKPVSSFAQKYPKIMQYTGLGTTVALIGLIGKNIYDVYSANKQADKNLARLKEQRYHIARDLANQYADVKRA